MYWRQDTPQGGCSAQTERLTKIPRNRSLTTQGKLGFFYAKKNGKNILQVLADKRTVCGLSRANLRDVTARLDELLKLMGKIPLVRVHISSNDNASRNTSQIIDYFRELRRVFMEKNV